MEWERAGWISLHASEWWWPAWRYGGWTLAGVALVLTLYSGIGYAFKHRDLIGN
jgi:cytochrome c oxidase assembly factor CtaG